MTLSVLGPHIAIGSIVLACFWIALLSRKGSKPHKAAGRTYLILLAPILLSVVPISLYFAERADPARVFQLAYLALVVTTAGWTAWRAIRDRRDAARFRARVFRTLAIMMALSGFVLLIVGVILARPLTIGFSFIGLVYGGAMLMELRKEPSALWWKVWHLNGVSLLFAATHASFIGIVAKTLAPSFAGEAMHTITQLGTISFAFVLRFWLVARYVTRNSAAPATAATAAR